MARLDKLKIKYQDIIPSLPGIPLEMLGAPSLVDDIFECVVAADPTLENKYVEWLIKAWQTGSFVYEDIQDGQNSVVGTNCHDFERLKKKLTRPDGTPDIQARSLMKYKNPGQLWKAIRHLLAVEEDEMSSNRELKRQESELAKQHAHEVVLRDGSVIRIPMTHLAAQFYGRQSRWCTSSSKTSEMFVFYASQSPLFIITTANGDRYQAYIGKINVELRNTADEKVNFATQDPADLDEALNYIAGLMVENNFYHRLSVQFKDFPKWDENVDKFRSWPGIKKSCRMTYGIVKLLSKEILHTALDAIFRRRSRLEILSEKLKQDIITRCTNKAAVKSNPTPEPKDISHLQEMMLRYKEVVRLDIKLSENHEAHAVLSDIISEFFHKIKVPEEGTYVFEHFRSAFKSVYESNPDTAYIDMLAHIYNLTSRKEIPESNTLYEDEKLNSLLWDYLIRDINIKRLSGLLEHCDIEDHISFFDTNPPLYRFIFCQFEYLKHNTFNNTSPNLNYNKVSAEINPEHLYVILTKCFYLNRHSVLSIKILGPHFFSNTSIPKGLLSAYQAYIKAGIPSLVDRRSSLGLPYISPDIMFDILTDMDFLSDNLNHPENFVSGLNRYVDRGVDKKALLPLLNSVGYEVLNNYRKFIQKGNDIDWDIARYLTTWDGIQHAKGYGFLATILSKDGDAWLYYRTIKDYPLDKNNHLKEKERYQKGLDGSIKAVSNVQKLLRLSQRDISIAMDFAKSFPQHIDKKYVPEERQKQVFEEVQNIASKIEIPEDILTDMLEICPAFVKDYIRLRAEHKNLCLDIECSHQT